MEGKKEKGKKLCSLHGDDSKAGTVIWQVVRIPLECFGAIVMGEDVKRLKPFPDIFLEAARRLGVAPAACCVIEDAINGVKAAKAAGMRCVAVTTSFTEEELMAVSADVVRASIAEITFVDMNVGGVT